MNFFVKLLFKISEKETVEQGSQSVNHCHQGRKCNGHVKGTAFPNNRHYTTQMLLTGFFFILGCIFQILHVYPRVFPLTRLVTNGMK